MAKWRGAGRFRHLVQIQQVTETVSAIGEPVPAWNTLATRHADIMPLSGARPWAAQQINPETTHLIALRYFAGLKPKMRLVYQGRIFNLLFVTNIEERNIEMECQAKEEV